MGVRKGVTLAQRIEEMSIPEPNSGCWLWLRSTLPSGYGNIGIDGKVWRAHRASWLAYRGEIGMLHVLHRCDNPCCVNPDHLFLGTQSDNMRDMFSKSRQNRNPPRGERHWNTSLTEEDVREIRAAPKYTRGLPEKYGVSFTTIHRIRAGECWQHVQEDITNAVAS